MSDNQYHVDALRNYLSGPQWRETIREFVATNCSFFSNIVDFHPQQAVIWRNFQEVAETVIQAMLNDIGGNMDDLEKAFEEILRTPSRGPKDEAIKDVLQQLDSVDDFIAFSQGMYQACCELFQELGKDIYDNIYDTIMRMGFAYTDIHDCIKVLGEDTTAEEALLYLTSKSEEKDNDAVGASKYLSPREDKQSDYNYRTKKDYYETPMDKFIAEAALQNVELDPSEVNALFVIAESVLEAQRDVALDENNPSETTEELVNWASDMKYLSEDMDTAFQQRIEGSDMTFHDENGLLHFYLTLEERRQKINAQIDSSNALFHLVSDSELRRMAELDAIAATGNENEQRLHRFLSRHEEVRKEIVNLYRKCAIFLQTHPEVQEDQVHQMYLLLKNQLTNDEEDNNDTAAMEEDMFLALATTPEQQQMVNILLDIHIREDEQAMIKREIHILLGIPYEEPNDVISDAKVALSLDEKGQFLEDAKQTSGNENNNIMGDDSFHAMMRLANEAPVLDSKADDKVVSEDKYEDKTVTVPDIAPMKSLLANTNANTNNDLSTNNGDAVVNALRTRHRQAVRQLKTMLENDKQRRLHRLEARLALLREHKSRDTTLTVAELKALDDEKKALLDESNALSESMISGFKHRCLAEFRTVNEFVNNPSNQGLLSPRGIAIDDVQVQLDRILQLAAGPMSSESASATSADASTFTNQAKNALLDKYEKETVNLLQRLQYQRKRQHDALQHRLHNRQGTSDLVGGEGEETVLDALRKNEEATMLSMVAAMYLSPTELIVTNSPSSKKNQAESKDDDYLNDDETAETSDDKQHHLQQWIDHVRSLQHSYQDVGNRLRADLIASANQQGEDGTANILSETQLQALLEAENVVVQAFAQHITQDAETHNAGFHFTDHNHYEHHGHKKDKQLQADIKAHILEAFEVAKQDYSNSMTANKDASHRRLRQRLTGGKSKALNSQLDTAEEDIAMESLLTKAIDAFVEDAPLAQDTKATSSSSAGTRKQDTAVRYDDLLMQEKERIKQDHSRNEQELVDKLQIAMEQKKRNLEDRLRHKRLQQQQDRGAKQVTVVASGIDPNAEPVTTEDDARVVKAQITAWDAAFHRVKSMVETNHSEFTPDQMSEVLDRVFKEMMTVSSKPTDVITDRTTPLAVFNDTKDSDTVSPTKKKSSPMKEALMSFESEAKEESLNSRKPPKGTSGLTIPSDPPSVSLQSAADELFGSEPTSANTSRKNSAVPSVTNTPHGREVLQSEAQRITSNFTQEQQRHDLMMKIQQARQRQTLQRKLWERNQQKQQQQPVMVTPAPLSGLPNEERDDLIGARRPWLQDAVAAKQSSEAVRGLVLPTNLPMRADSKRIVAARGMDLGPMMMRK